MTSSLPRKCSTPELHRHHFFLSGRRGSNSRPSAWKADALSTELLPQLKWAGTDSNRRRRQPTDLQSARFNHLPTYPKFWASCRIRTNDPEITNHVLWPTELKRRFHFLSDFLAGAKLRIFFNSQNIPMLFFLKKSLLSFFLHKKSHKMPHRNSLNNRGEHHPPLSDFLIY